MAGNEPRHGGSDNPDDDGADRLHCRHKALPGRRELDL